MRRIVLSLLVLLWAVPSFAQQVTLNGTLAGTSPACQALHKDAAVNNQVVLTVPAAPLQEQYVYICGWDWQVVENGTGTAQTNVLWTTTNMGNPSLSAEYSVPAAANSIVSGNFTYPNPVRATNPGPVVFTSPAAATNNAYSLNVYYRYGN